MPVTTSAILGGIQTATGIAQYLKGQKLAKDNARPQYNIPDEIKQNLSQAQLQALQGLPEAQKEEYVKNIQRQQTFGLNAIGTRQGGLAGLAELTQSGTDAYNKLLSQDAQARMANVDKLSNARNTMAQYQDKSFELNKLLPFQQKAAAAQGMTGAGMQNIFGGLKGAQSGYENMALANVYANKGVPPTATQPIVPPNAPPSQPPPTFGQASAFPNQAPQRTDLLNQYQIARLSNPNLSYEDFIKTQQPQGLSGYLNITQ